MSAIYLVNKDYSNAMEQDSQARCAITAALVNFYKNAEHKQYT